MITLRRIQQVLRSFGFYRGLIDGVLGPKTIKAVKCFQSINPPLLVDGKPGVKTCDALFEPLFGDRDTVISSPEKDNIPTQSQVPQYYGRMGRNQVKVMLPYKMRIAWEPSKLINQFSCHKKVADNIQGIFEQTLNHYGMDEVKRLGLDLFGGCYNVRKMRGGNKYSMHSWGIAVDIDPARNRFKWNSDKAELAKPEYNEFWNIVESNGAVSLGRGRNFDWMHFQFARF